MKKILSILLVFVFFYSFVGFYLNFAIEQCRIKEEVKEKIIHNLPDKYLTIIKVSSRNLEKITWTEEGNEFRYGGNLYDVVKIRQVNGDTYYSCYCDVKESKLIANLDKLVKDQTDHSQSRTIQKKIQINIFFHDGMLAKSLNNAPVDYFSYTPGYKLIYTDVLSPPPRLLAIFS
jgi:hypothetical protein